MTRRGPVRVVLIGSESTGKSALAARLADRFQAVLSVEHARRYAEATGIELGPNDVEPIARGQIALEDASIAAAGRLVILDTDLVSTVAYARHYYGACPRWIERAARTRLADLYLLHHPDVPWVADPGIRDRPDRRPAVHAEFARVLGELGATVVDVAGPFGVREEIAVRAITGLLASRPGA